MLQAITKEGSALLAAIKGSESPDYNTIFGGKKFDSYNDHPRVLVDIPWNDKFSSAAGAYQITKTTFDEFKGMFGVSDFTPQSQDKFAWMLAQTRYKSGTGQDLQTDLQAGKLKQVANALSPTWTSLPGGNESNKATQGFYDRYLKGLTNSGAFKIFSAVTNTTNAIFQPLNQINPTSAISGDIQDEPGIIENTVQRVFIGVIGLGLFTLGIIKLKA